MSETLSLFLAPAVALLLLLFYINLRLASPLLAIPMGLTSRRQPTSIRIVVGIAILIVYYQMLNFGKDMAENGRVSTFVALWVPFLVFSLGSTYLFHVANSRLNQDPFAIVFGSIDDGWRWLRGLFRRRRRRPA